MPSHPYALYARPDSVHIRWQTRDPEIGAVTCRPESGGQVVVFHEPAAVTDHDVLLTGLAPATRYVYQNHSGPFDLSFRTAARPEDDAVRFVVFGDPQNHGALAEIMRQAAATRPDFAIGLGDFAGAATEDQFDHFFALARPLLDHTVLYPTPGNHDYRRHARPFDRDNDTALYDRRLGDGAGNNGVFDQGPIRLILLNYPDSATLALDGPRVAWLRQQLAAAAAAGRRVVLAHHCACFTSTAASWAAEAAIVPPLATAFPGLILADFGGHLHTYERSFHPPSQTTFITSGGAGELYDFPPGIVANPLEQAAANALHFCQVEIAGGVFALTAIDWQGEIIDHYRHPL